MGIKAIVYLDDWLVYGPSEEQCREHGFIVKDVLEKLGFIINHKKSSLIPTQEIEWLGVLWNTRWAFILM